jgi:LmbE family N-acetylglucosaminyl deacetylase
VTPARITVPAAARRLGTVLGVWAHPDDESYLSAGLMALARRAGNRVVCVSATLGEHGTDNPDRWPPPRLALVRDAEVKAALAALGVDDHRVLGFEDGTLAAIDTGVGADTIVRLLHDVRPDTLVTFGPDGMTGHPDHCAVSRWVTEAWQRTGGHARLLYATTTDEFADEFADLHDEIDVFGPGLPLRTPVRDVALTVDLDTELQSVKLAALRAHASQVEPLIAMIGEERFTAWFRRETFTNRRSA